MSGPWRLDGRLALVTGASRGIGSAVAEELLGLGASVILAARTPADVQRRAAELAARGLPATAVVADVATAAGRDALVAEVEARGGVLDVLVNNVGTNVRKRAMEYEDEEALRLIDVNLLSAWAMCRALHPALSRAGAASVVNVVSVSGVRFTGTGVPYAMSKAGVIQMTRGLAVEWAVDGIRVNAVAPWYIRTPLVESILSDPERLARILERTPLGRVGEPEEVARAVAFLALPAASYVTGDCLAVDGGFLAKGF